MPSFIYPFQGSFPVTETFAQGDPGTDWGMPIGTPILAIADGVVSKIGANGYGPAYVQIDHGNGLQSFYGHNSKALVTVGQHVRQGQVIALSGNAGISTGPHLELGILVNGKHVDPVAFLKSQGATITSAAFQTVGNPLDIPGDIIKALVNMITGPIRDAFKTALGWLVAGLEVFGGVILLAMGAIFLFESTETGKNVTRKAIEIGALVAK